MKTAVLRYNVLIKKEGKQFIAYVPTLGISDFGSSLELAKNHVQDAIDTHIAGLLKTGTEVPAPDSTEFFVSQAEVTIPRAIKLAL